MTGFSTHWCREKLRWLTGAVSLGLDHGREDSLHEGGEVVGGPAGDEIAVANAGGVLPDPAGVLDVVSNREEARHLAALQAAAEQSIQGPWQIAATTLFIWAAWVTRSIIGGCRRMWSGE